MNREHSAIEVNCRSCGTQGTWPGDGQCPACGARFTAPSEQPEGDILDRPPRSMWDSDSLLPVDRSAAVSFGEGGTPTVAAPSLEAASDVGTLLLKDEGQNPTGSVRDREVSLAVTAAVTAGVDGLSLADTGAAVRSLAAYAARAGLEGSAVLPARARFDHKAMTNVHKLALTVVDGRLPAAEGAIQDARADGDPGTPLDAFSNPFRHVGARTLAPEIVASGPLPDAILVPTGEGTTIVGLYEGFCQLKSRGAIERLPRLYAVQPTGCAPIADAFREQRPIEPIERPDTVCGELEVPDPRGGEWVLDILEATSGGTVAVSDDRILDAAVDAARSAGIEASPGGAAGLAGLEALRAEGQIEGAETVLAIVSGTGGADLLRSHAGVRDGR
jgi:threonine synthase